MDTGTINLVVTLATPLAVAALAYFGTRKGNRDHNREDVKVLQAEISRLREDLAERDELARANYDEIVALRSNITELQQQVAERDSKIDDLTSLVVDLKAALDGPNEN